MDPDHPYDRHPDRRRLRDGDDAEKEDGWEDRRLPVKARGGRGDDTDMLLLAVVADLSDHSTHVVVALVVAVGCVGVVILFLIDKDGGGGGACLVPLSPVVKRLEVGIVKSEWRNR